MRQHCSYIATGLKFAAFVEYIQTVSARPAAVVARAMKIQTQ